MRLTTVYSAIIILLAVGALIAADNKIDTAVQAKLSFELQEKTDFRVFDYGARGLTLAITLPSAVQALRDADIPIAADPAGLSMVSKWVAIPDGMTANVRADRQETTVYRANQLGGWSETDATAANISFPEDSAPVRIGRPANFRGVRMVPLMVQPLQSGDDGAALVENRRITVDIEFSPDPQAVAASAKKPFSPQLSRMLDEIAVNPPPRDFASNHLSRMLVVYNEDLAGQNVMDDLNAWADWKRRLGYDVTLLGFDVSDDQDDIKNAMRAYYEDVENGSLEFLVIIGSFDLRFVEDDSPYYFPHYGWIEHQGNEDLPVIGDIYWATFDGDDYVPDVITSRFPCQSAQDLSYALSRSRRYEQTPQGGDWLRRCIQVIDAVDNPARNGRPDLETTLWAQRRLAEMGYAPIDTIWGQARHEICEPIQDAFDNGASLGLGCGWNYGVVNYVGPTLEIDDMSEVGRMHPFLISNVEHYTQPIFADFFNAGDVDDENGLLAGFGFIEPVDGNRLVSHLVGWSVWGMRYLQEYTGGYLFQFALMQFIPVEEYYAADENSWEEMGQLHYYGDPTIQIRNREPVALASNLPNTVNAGATLLQFTLTAGDGPAPGAAICIMQPGGLHYVAHSAADGSVAFTIPEGVDPDEALLVTASLHNTLPLMVEMEVDEPRVNIVLEEGGFEDENDGLFMNGETVDLTLTLANRGNSNAQNLTANFSSDSEFLQFSRDNAPVQNINAGATGTLAQPVSMTLSPACPGGTLIQVRIDVASGNDHWQHAFDLTTSGPMLILSNIQPRNIEPRSQGGLAITLMNMGDGASDALTATLTTATRGVDIIVGERSYAAIDAGQARAANDEFTLEFTDHFITGNDLNLNLNLVSQRGYEQNIPFAIGPIGEPAADDPLGPDGYGYACFDSEDNRDDWSLTPQYRWMEVNPFVIGEGDHYPGRLVRFPFAPCDSLIDMTYWDDRVEVPLPFTFRYYGQEYDTLVVCTNGWISMGAAERRNRSAIPWPIPGISGPDGQIAPYAIDLKINDIYDQMVGVYTYYNANEDIFVIEWSNVGVTNEMDDILNFEIVLYNPEIYSTPTGDGEIAFQYKNARILRGSSEYPFPLIGIRSLNGNDGVMYSWRNNEYADHPQFGNPPVQAVDLHNEFALLFTTAVQLEQGSAHGRIVNAENDQPLANVVINPHRAAAVLSQNDGSFRFDNLRVGHYRALVSAPGFSDFTLIFEVLEGQDIELPTVRLLRPMPRLRQELYEYFLRPDTAARVQAWACLENAGAGSLNYTAEVRYEDGSAPNYNVVQQLHLDSIAVNGQANRYIRGYGPAYAPELESYFIPSHHRGTEQKNIAVVNKEGQQTGVFPQPIPADNDDARLITLAWDGQALWGGYQTLDALNPVMMMRFSTQGESLFAFQTPFANIGSLPVVYSPQRNSLFINERDQDIYEFDRDGNYIHQFHFSAPGHIPEISGLGWNPYDFDGMPLYAVDQWKPEGGDFTSMSFYKINPETGDKLLLRRVDFNPNALPRAAYGATVALDYSAARNAVVTIQQYGLPSRASDSMFVRELGVNLNFMVPNSFHEMSGVIPADGFTWLGFEADGAGRAHGSEARWSYYITHNGPEAPLLARVTLRFDSTSSIDFGGETPPSKFGLRSIYPNPFNGMTRIGYVTSERIPTRIAAYDLQGRLARELYNGVPEVGEHQIYWEADLPSGVYLIRMECNSAAHSRKVVLLK